MNKQDTDTDALVQRAATGNIGARDQSHVNRLSGLQCICWKSDELGRPWVVVALGLPRFVLPDIAPLDD